MDEFWEKVEHYNSRLIPFALVALLGIIIAELFFHTENEQFNLFLEIVDYFVNHRYYFFRYSFQECSFLFQALLVGFNCGYSFRLNFWCNK
ncbi:hypothetical protein J4444_03800 [Candidatus Woesearchaeota archaeon]|nr:hypothetical protein [Candidatus Woesearchaeota archaeon]